MQRGCPGAAVAGVSAALVLCVLKRGKDEAAHILGKFCGVRRLYKAFLCGRIESNEYETQGRDTDMKKETKSKAPASEKEKDPKRVKNTMIFQLVLGVALLIVGFVLRFGAFTLFGGGCLLLALTNYVTLNGTPKSRKESTPPSDSLPRE